MRGCDLKPVKMIAVHYANKSGRGQAALFVTEDTAREMFEAGLAVWNKKATYLNLTKTEASLAPTARSIKMGPDVIFSCAMGDVRDCELRDAWECRKAA
jgi:hypothetical protein